ncbi:nucleotide-diphospho-sugar transferase [Cokeromyces recurvatus]|uniref:nucleotide-diphospho-sugar transferase n=1 Tax=Cokeromyces recurvatus TaxID=90255 RepID=UPI00222089A7|nr:nucleotide-diphospho-sugar transferase [Cokeromyces recurvatus]KAI7906301.1 nucleotide-diphospho-sugar transferase [Cokeromyces recurvatus]
MPAFPILSFSRKPILLIIFIIVFVFLYHIASHPKVSKSMQSVAYYNNYDERACLPQRLLEKSPPTKKAKAAMVILVRNREQQAIAETLANFQDKFNKNFNYPYVFLNEQPFTEDFKRAMKEAAPQAEMKFGLVPEKHWSYPAWVDPNLAAEARIKMDQKGVLYGGLESYHHMCRYQSGFFFDHPLLDEYEWYWRVEPGVKYFCDITYDPFLYMEKHKKKYGFVVTLLELRDTIPSLWKTVEEYAKSRRIDISNNSNLLFPYFRNSETGDFNLCHFWSNFEIASLNFWRSPEYRDFFHYLDQTGNFFYERWGDAPVHSLAAGLFLKTDEIHYFQDFGYQHDLYRHCPTKESGLRCRCECPEGTNEKSIDHDTYYDTCLPVWLQHVKKEEERKKANWSVWS